MKKRELMREFIKLLDSRNLLTLFIKNIFNYQEFNDYNYLFRMVEDGNKIIIDIYDNVSVHRFNRYIFNFGKKRYDGSMIFSNDNVYVTYIDINYLTNNASDIFRLGYLFKIKKGMMLDYAKDFFDDEILVVLEEILKKPI